MDSCSLESRFSSILPRIEFGDVQDLYSYNEDLLCKYSLIDYRVQEGDRIAIFKLGWQYVKDYVLFEWVPRCPDENHVIFNKLSLPKSTIEIYQFCFISGENNVLGASEPFQFCDRPRYHASLFSSISKRNTCMTDSNMLMNDSSLPSLNVADVIDKDKEIMRLKEENDLLRNTLKIIVMQKQPKNYDPDIQKIKERIFDLQTMVNAQQSQIKELQMQIIQCNEDQKQLQKEKMNLHNTCDGLKNKLDNYETNIRKAVDIEIGELESIPPFPFAK